ncbi:hypothetical protein ACG7TL_004004 [Trametes sanguinea]
MSILEGRSHIPTFTFSNQQGQGPQVHGASQHAAALEKRVPVASKRALKRTAADLEEGSGVAEHGQANILSDSPEKSHPGSRKSKARKTVRDTTPRRAEGAADDITEQGSVSQARSAHSRPKQRSSNTYTIPRSAYDSSDDNEDNSGKPLSVRIPPRPRARKSVGVVDDDQDDPSLAESVYGRPSDNDEEVEDDMEDLVDEDPQRLAEILDAEIPTFPSQRQETLSERPEDVTCSQSTGTQVPAHLRLMYRSGDGDKQPLSPEPVSPSQGIQQVSKTGGMKTKVTAPSRRQQAFEIEKPYFRSDGPDVHPDKLSPLARGTEMTLRLQTPQSVSRQPVTPAAPRAVLGATQGSTESHKSRPFTRSGAAVQKHIRADSVIAPGAGDNTESDGDLDATEVRHAAHGGNPWASVPDPVVSPASGEVLLKRQGKAVQDIIDHVNEQVKYHVAFIDGFPDTGMKGTLSKRLLRKEAKKLGHTDIAARLAADPDYVNKLARVPDNRISHLRTQVKKACAVQVVSQYGLRPGDGGRVQRWLDRRFYIFPGDVDKRLEKNLPYEHPIFIEVIASCFFRGPDSIATKWASMFRSSHPDLPDELEVPQAMVALVATAVHNALSEWRTGTHRAIQFHGAVHEEQYRGHIDILEGIKGRSLRTYHAMMHRLYTAASSSTGIKIDASESNPDATIEMIEFDDTPDI